MESYEDFTRKLQKSNPGVLLTKELTDEAFREGVATLPAQKKDDNAAKMDKMEPRVRCALVQRSHV